MGKEPAEQSESIGTKIRKMLTDLGPSGIVMVIAAIFSITLLLKDDLGSLSGKNVSSAQSSVEVKHKEQITAIFESIEGVTVDSINISYKTVADSSTTLFASSQTDTVSNGVVIVYRGTLKASYDVTQAISLLLDVPIHQISLLNASELGGN
ncbi:MAG: hypothetical protein Q4Q00_01120 [Turicibacter sp.]|nr:hypothetical protein [Turicibacter sp.]